MEPEGDFVYSGEENCPAVTVRKCTGDEAALDASDYEVSYSNHVNAGTGLVTVTGKGNYTGSISAWFTIRKAPQKVTAHNWEKTTEDLIFPLEASASGGGILTYASGNPEVAVVDDHGIVLIRGAGTAEIHIRASETPNYRASEYKTILLTVRPAGTDGSGGTGEEPGGNDPNPVLPGTDTPGTNGEDADLSGLTVTKLSYTKALGSKPFSLGASADTQIEYASSRPDVALVSADGRVTLRGCGKTVITVTAGTAKRSVTVCVVPKKAKIKKTALKSGKLTVSWVRQKEADGYVIEYSTDKKMKKQVQRKTVKGSKTTKIVLGKLRKGKKYYVRVKAYTTIDKKKAYGAESKKTAKKVV